MLLSLDQSSLLQFSPRATLHSVAAVVFRQWPCLPAPPINLISDPT